MSEVAQAKHQSLKEILAKLRETDAIMGTTESRLDYLVNGSGQDKADEEKASQNENATLDNLNVIANQIGRKASNIAGHANQIVGN